MPPYHRRADNAAWQLQILVIHILVIRDGNMLCASHFNLHFREYLSTYVFGGIYLRGFCIAFIYVRVS